MINADLGLAPWDVLHQGIAEHTGLQIGTVAIIVGFVVLLAWIPLHERYGIGTVLFALTVGPNVHFWLDRLSIAHPEPDTIIGAE